MAYSKEWSIPGYSRYIVRIKPFEIISDRGKSLNWIIRRESNSHPRVQVYRDDGTRHQVSVYTIAALAFHGQRPDGCDAHFYGGDITPAKVQWVPRKVLNGLRNKKLTDKQLDQIDEWYFCDGLTQQEIADRLGVAQSWISRRLNYYRRVKKAS